MAKHFSGPVYSTNGFVGDVTGALIGTAYGNSTGAHVGTHFDSVAPTAYAGNNVGARTIDPAIAVATLTKASAETAYTLAVPGTNVNKLLTIYSATAYQHVVTVAGCLGGTTFTFTAAAIGISLTLYAISATAWVVIKKNGATQTA
jgi:hypothetical protein